MIVGIILAICQLIPQLLNLAGVIMSALGASDAQIQTYQDMVNKQNDLGNLSVEDHDKLMTHQAAIEARQKAKAALAAKSPRA